MVRMLLRLFLINVIWRMVEYDLKLDVQVATFGTIVVNFCQDFFLRGDVSSKFIVIISYKQKS